MDQLADFLGHDISVHRQFYRLSEPTVQSAKISKLLLALERGKLSELRGKTLDEIGDFTDDDDEDDESEEDTTLGKDIADEIGEQMDTSDRGKEADRHLCGQNGNNLDISERPTCSTANRHIRRHNVAGKQKPNRAARRPWSNAELSAVMRHFKAHISKGHLASLRECELCKKCEPVLQNRTLQNIRDFVRNRGLTLKRKLTVTLESD